MSATTDTLAGLEHPRPGDGILQSHDERLRATYVLQGDADLEAAAEAVAIEESTGTRRHTEAVGRRVGGRIERVEVADSVPPVLDAPVLRRRGVEQAEIGRVTVSWPAENAVSAAALVGLIAGETFETGTFGVCRLVGAEIPTGVLEAIGGPAFGRPGIETAFEAAHRPVIGAIIKPSTGLEPSEFARVAGDLARGGADFVKDDEILTDPPHCPLVARVRATTAMLADVADETGRRAAYAPNVTGDLAGLASRLELAARHDCGMVMMNSVVMGFEALRFAAARATVPVLAHRVLAGALTRSPAVGIAPGVLAGLTRVAGGDLVQVGAVYGKIFEPAEVVVDSADNCRRDLGPLRASLPVSGGGQSAATVVHNAAELGTEGFCHLLGSAAVDDPHGPEAGVAKAVIAWQEECKSQ